MVIHWNCVNRLAQRLADPGVDCAPMQLRTLARYGLVLFGGLLAGRRSVDALHAWRGWHRWALADPSAADLYRTNFWVDVVILVLTLGIVGLLYRSLKRHS